MEEKDFNESPDRGAPQSEGHEPDLKYKDGKEVAKGGLLGLFIGLAIIAPAASAAPP